MRVRLAVAVAFAFSWSALALALPAQCQGNGGAARLETSALVLGTTVTTSVVGGANQPFAVGLSPGLAPVDIPGIGLVCIDLFHPGFGVLYEGALDGNGRFAAPFAVPATLPWWNVVFFLQAVVTDPALPGGLALSNAARKDYETADSLIETAAPPVLPGAAAGCHLPRRNRAFLAAPANGAAPGATMWFSGLLRAFAPGPAPTAARSEPTLTVFGDDRVLIAGGYGVSQQGVAAVEVFDPDANAIAPAAPMARGRVGHVAVALRDGRILVAGGSPTLSVSPLFGVPSQGAQFFDDAEVYDPGTNSWTPVANPMQARRGWGDAVLLADGRVLLSGGWSAVHVIPVYLGNLVIQESTNTCDFYDPVLNRFDPAPSMPTFAGRAGHRSALLSDGSVLVVGGMVGTSSSHASTNSTLRLQGGQWTSGASLPAAVAYHQLLQVGPDRFVAYRSYPGSCILRSNAGATSWSATIYCPTFSQTFTGLVSLAEGQVLMLPGGLYPATTGLLYTPAP